MKKILAIALLAFAVVPAFAQTREEHTTKVDTIYVTEPTGSYWFGAIAGGTNVYLGEHNRQINPDNGMSYFNLLGGVGEISFGRYFNPYFGVRLMYSNIWEKGATKQEWMNDDRHSNNWYGTGEDLGFHGLQKEKFMFGHLHVDALFNISNILGGYKPERFWNVVPYAGVGVAHTWTKPNATPYDEPKFVMPMLTGGILNNFYINQHFDANLDVRGNLFNEMFDGNNGNEHEGYIVASVGLTYKFGHKFANRAKSTIVTNDNNLYTEKLVEKIINKGGDSVLERIATDCLVLFQKDHSELSNETKANLQLFADAVKKGTDNVVYTISGYADAGTGTIERNITLSHERADNVFNYLVNECGVDAKMLKREYNGGVDNMYFNDPRLSRSVLCHFVWE